MIFKNIVEYLFVNRIVVMSDYIAKSCHFQLAYFAVFDIFCRKYRPPPNQSMIELPDIDSAQWHHETLCHGGFVFWSVLSRFQES